MIEFGDLTGLAVGTECDPADISRIPSYQMGPSKVARHRFTSNEFDFSAGDATSGIAGALSCLDDAFDQGFCFDIARIVAAVTLIDGGRDEANWASGRGQAAAPARVFQWAW